MFRLRISLVVTALLIAARLQGQSSTGRIAGIVVEAESNRPVSDAGVQIVGTSFGAMTNAEGRFTILNVPVGTVTIQVRRLGYQPQTATGLLLEVGRTLTPTIALSPIVTRVAAQVVRAHANSGSVSAALDEQRQSNNLVSSVTAEQISRSPDANAAQAVQRVSGVTVQDGRYVFVRGLGERYTTTSLNGARVPSPEPERKVVPFDLFPSGLLQQVTTTKSFSPDLPGDFSGASVDIRTREYPLNREITYGGSLGYSDGTLQSRIAFAPGVGGEALAFAGGSRGMPAPARAGGDLSLTTQAQKNEIINSFRDVWRPGSHAGRPDGSFRASMGGNSALAGRRVGYLLSGTYSYSHELKDGQSRALARPTSETSQVEYNHFDGTTSGQSVLWGGLLNAGTLLSANSRLSLNAMYNRSADNDARVEHGTFEDLAVPAEITRLDYVQRSMWSTQLVGEHDRGRQALEWALSGSGVSRDEPDRSELVYEIVPATSTSPARELWMNTLAEGAVRTFSTLGEHAGEARASYRWNVGSAERQAVIKTGALARGVSRDANTMAFGIFAPIMEDSVRALSPEELFGGRFTAPDSSVLNVRSLAQGGSYTAQDGIVAGFAMADLPITSTWKLVAGARMERSQVLVKAASTLGDKCNTNRAFTDVLPSVALAYRPNDVHAVRLSGSRTLARPEYRELACIRSRDVLGGIDQSGNPDLVRTMIDNLDLRWEMYPRDGELLSVAVFAKRFHDPIERVFKSSSTNSFVGFVNAHAADNVGAELEARTSLDRIADRLAPLSLFSSVTVMRSQIHLGSVLGASTNANRAMVGQAPYVINAGVTYASFRTNASATLLYNRVGSRISEAGEQPLPDVTELPRDVLDFSVRIPASRGLTAAIDAKNLLGARYELMQGSITRETYRIGRTLRVGLNLER